jgi:hypothetical protein
MAWPTCRCTVTFQASSAPIRCLGGRAWKMDSVPAAGALNSLLSGRPMARTGTSRELCRASEAARVYTHTLRVLAHTQQRQPSDRAQSLSSVFPSRLWLTLAAAKARDRGRPARCTANSARRKDAMTDHPAFVRDLIPSPDARRPEWSGQYSIPRLFSG